MERVQKQRSSQKTEEVAEQELAAKTTESDHTITDALLDEIDEVLEQNAEQFVRDYVQKGGQ